jgi:hypothetical protein
MNSGYLVFVTHGNAISEIEVILKHFDSNWDLILKQPDLFVLFSKSSAMSSLSQA